MEGGGEREPARAVVYCIVPRALAAKLHGPLRRHFRDDESVEVVVEQRADARRSGSERRGEDVEPPVERRLMRGLAGRRVADRRATGIPVPAPELPRRLRLYADRLRFLELLVPSKQELEERDSARVVTRFQAGDQDAFALLYVRYFDRVYSYLRVVLADEHAAEDATQQVFTKVFQALASYERRAGRLFRAWLFTIARNEALDVLRVSGRASPTDPGDLARLRGAAPVGEDLSALGWISDRELLMFVERLPAVQRQVLVLRYMLDLTYKDIAEVLGRTEVDVRGLHMRGVRFLRERLAALGRESGSRCQTRMRGCLRRAPVLHGRRWALMR